MDQLQHELFMRRVFDLAVQGRGKVSPNPMVGCVIVKNGKVIGEGFHEKYGEPHAEANAISRCDKQELSGAELYVNLEPCSHFGKRPPCADLIVQYPFSKVVLSNVDSNPLVSGGGIAKIKAAGIEVIEGVFQKEGRMLNRRFFTYMEKKRPFIILKWAQTSDGFIARNDYSSKWISNSYSRKMVHQWRTEEDAVMVGTNTARYDNPQLNVRDWQGRNPVRVVIDFALDLPADLFLFDGSQKTICYNFKKSSSEPNLEYVQVNSDENLLNFILEDLYNRKIQSLIVEGGAALLKNFIKLNLWDEARVFHSDVRFEAGIVAPVIQGKIIDKQRIENDELLIYVPY